MICQLSLLCTTGLEPCAAAHGLAILNPPAHPPQESPCIDLELKLEITIAPISNPQSPKAANHKALNPKTLNPKTLNPKNLKP